MTGEREFGGIPGGGMEGQGAGGGGGYVLEAECSGQGTIMLGRTRSGDQRS